MILSLKHMFVAGTTLTTLLWMLLLSQIHLNTTISNPTPPKITREHSEGDAVNTTDAYSLAGSGEKHTEALNESRHLPREYFDGSALPNVNSTCASFPQFFTINYSNLYWQTAVTSNGTFELFGAYWDDRKPGKPTVRLLGALNRATPTVKTYCQFWYKTRKKPVTVQSESYVYIWLDTWGVQGVYRPYFINCAAPTKEVPFAVSLVEAPCENATNALRVINNKSSGKRRFAICVKGLDYPYDDVSVRLIEWIEINRALGADKIYFYYFTLHPNITKTLRFYEEQGFVESTPLTLPGSYPNLPSLRHLVLHKRVTQRRHMEVIPYNDCFYHHMYEYDYIVLLDTDEIIMPKTGNWHALLKTVENDWKIKHANAFYTRNVYFLDQFFPKGLQFPGIPSYLHIMNHVYRTRTFTQPRHYVKTFHKTKEVVALHNHLPLSCMEGNCVRREIDPQLAQLQHYRNDCVSNLKKICAELKKDVIMDTSVWRFKEPVVEKVMEVMESLGYVKLDGEAEQTKEQNSRCECGRRALHQNKTTVPLTTEGR